jgi:hypothetical protein
MRRLIEGAWLSPDAEDQATYLYGVDSSGSGGFADTLVITAVGQPANGGYLNEPEPEFEDLNDRFGPQGGLSEIMVSTLPVGDAPPVSGVFVRTQRPADGDPSQGGYESVLTEDVSDLRFEFFDGLDWQTEWDTVELIRRLPSAVRVIYTLAEEQFERTFVVGLIHSDVTPDDPAVLETEEALQP